LGIVRRVRAAPFAAMGAESSRELHDDMALCCRVPWKSRPARRVEMAYTQFGPGLPGIKAYHTSIIIQGREYSFGNTGVVQAPPLTSHEHLTREHDIMLVGHTTLTGDEMIMALRQFFNKGTYDMLRKNCNTFSDAAMFFLLGIRLNPGFCELERVGYLAEHFFHFMQGITGGSYRPNPAAKNFDIEQLITRITHVKSHLGIPGKH